MTGQAPRGPTHQGKENWQAEQLLHLSEKRSLLLVTSRHIGWVGIRKFLQDRWHWWIVADVSRPEDALDAARKYHPDLILLAADPVDDGLPAIVTRLYEASADSHIVILSGEDEIPWMVLTHPGVSGCLCWSDIDEGHIQVSLNAAEIGCWIGSQHVMNQLMVQHASENHKATSGLTENERAVLRGFESGLTEGGIATAEHMSRRTVQRAIASLQRKLDARSRYLLGKRVRELRLD